MRREADEIVCENDTERLAIVPITALHVDGFRQLERRPQQLRILDEKPRRGGGCGVERQRRWIKIEAHDPRETARCPQIHIVMACRYKDQLASASPRS